jgi:hypothetical protein
MEKELGRSGVRVEWEGKERGRNDGHKRERDSLACTSLMRKVMAMHVMSLQLPLVSISFVRSKIEPKEKR